MAFFNGLSSCKWHFFYVVQVTDIVTGFLQLSQRVQESVEGNTLTIEPIPGDSSYPRLV